MDQEARYHHGDLRRALLDAAREIIRTEGVSGLTLRKVARAAKVSHAAPYHHFRDKGALLAAVAEGGFRELGVSVAERSAAAEHPAQALQEAAVAYVVFAVEHPGLFRLMFGPQLSDKAAYPSLRASASAAYGAIGRGLERCSRPGEQERGKEAESMAMASWSLMHGLAMLLVDKQFGAATGTEAEVLARQVTDVFWAGLSRDHPGSDAQRK